MARHGAVSCGMVRHGALRQADQKKENGMTATNMIARETGEVLEVRTFDFATYVKALATPQAFALQQELARAYDAAVRSLIGPGDVQREGNREFKKKSGWRKLQRHFGISTEVVRVTKDWISVTDLRDSPVPGGLIPPVFVATVTVKATAPWGQSSESIGACATDEETGRRKISIADCISTAETRGSNRAVSNLVAAGEVSAEELSKGKPGKIAPRLEDLTEVELLDYRVKAESKNRSDVIDRINAELERRRTASLDEVPPELDR